MNIHKMTVGVCVCLLLAAFLRADSMHPVHWTSGIPLKNVAEIDESLKATVDMSRSGGTLECSHDEDTDKTTDCKTCEDYFRWLDQGNSADNTYQITMESWFKYACLPFLFLKEAQPSKYDYIEKLDLSNVAWQVMRPLIAIVAEDEDSEDNDRTVVSREKNLITIGSDEDVISIEQVAWGDYNHDGYEDCLMYLTYNVTGGTLRYYTYAVVTQLTSDAKLKVLTELKYPPK